MSDELDISLFEVYLDDARKLSKALGDGLLAFADNAGDVDRALSLMRLAHSLKGASSSVVTAEGFPALTPVVSMAQAMESCFNAVRAGRIVIDSHAIGEFLECVGHVAAMGALPIPDLKDWLLSKAPVFNSLAARISEIEKGAAPAAVKEASAVQADPPGHGDLAELSLLGLFRVEAETQVGLLSEGIMKLEADPSSSGETLVMLMRAAHSLKGAARIVQLDDVVTLAHSIENCLSAVLEGSLVFDDSHFDLLLQGVDLIGGVSSLEESGIPPFIEANREKFRSLAATYEAMKSGGRQQPSPSAAPQVSPSQDAKAEGGFAAKASFVRVGAERLNKLLGLAGESVVDVKRMRSLETGLLSLKGSFFELTDAMAHEPSAVDGQDAERLALLRRRQDGLYRDISSLYTSISDFLLKMDNFSGKLYNEALSCRIRPFEDGIAGFPRMVRDVSKRLGKKVRLEINGRRTDVDRDILEKLESPLNHIIRNAIDHGVESPEERLRLGKPECGLIEISAYHWAGYLNVKVSDDGAGIDIEALRGRIVQKSLASVEMVKAMSDAEVLEFLFLPGFSTAKAVTEISGRGVGLDVVQSMAQEVRGSVKIETKLGKGTSFHLQLPVTLSVIPSIGVDIAGELYALPLVRIERLLSVGRDSIQSLGSHQFITHDGVNIGLVSAHELLGLPMRSAPEGELKVVVVGDRTGQYAVLVDAFLGERDVVVRPLDERLGKVSFISAASFCGDGSPLLILDVDDMIRAIESLLKGGALHRLVKQEARRRDRKRVLVADDSLTVRELERNLLANHGYEVDVAVDGAEAWNAIRLGEYDLVVTDVDMPRMNGFELVERLKANERLRSLPVVIVSYKDREEDRVRGLDVGADYYLTKGSFHDNSFIQAVTDLTGGASR